MLGDRPIHPVLLAKDLAAARELHLAAWIVDPGGNALGIFQFKG